MPNPLEYGVVVTEPDGRVNRFLEKPSWGEVFSDHANTGIYVIEPSVLEHIKPDVSVDWSQDVFPKMLRRKEPLYGIVAQGYWCDIGSIQSYMQANWDALEGHVRCHIPGRREGNVWIGDGVEFGIGVQLEGPAFIGDEVKLKAGAFINGHAVIDKYAIIDDNAKVSNTVIWPHSYIGENCRLRQSIVCRNVTIKNGSLLEENTVIGDDCVIGHGSRIRSGVKIWPHKEVEPGSTVHEFGHLGGGVAARAVLVVWHGRAHQRRADPGVLRTAGRGVRGDDAAQRHHRGGPRPCAQLTDDQARHRLGPDQRGRDGSRPQRAAGPDNPVSQPAAATATPVSTCSSPRSTSAAPTSASSTVMACRSTSARSASSRTCSFARISAAPPSMRWGTSSTSTRRVTTAAISWRRVDAAAIRAAGFRVLIDYDFSQASTVLPGVLD